MGLDSYNDLSALINILNFHENQSSDTTAILENGEENHFPLISNNI